MADFYSTAQEVIRQCGVRPEDFDITAQDTDDEATTTQAVLIRQIETWLVRAKDFIDRSRNRDYFQEGEVPEGIHSIACQIVCNMVGYARETRKSPFIKIGEVTVRIADPQIITPSIQRALDLFPRKLNGIKSLFRMTRLRGKEELDEANQNSDDITVT